MHIGSFVIWYLSNFNRSGAISSIVDENVGMAISDLNEIDTSLTFLVEKYISKQVSIKCRDKYLKKYSTQKFERFY